MARPTSPVVELSPTKTRFAPSPSGALHLGHAYAAIYAHDLAAALGGTFLVRIEDIDRGRCRREYEDAIFEDLAWLGLSWQEPVRRQSEHIDEYQAAIDELRRRELVYPCFCTRKEIAAEIARSPSAPHGPEGPIYPGTCRHIDAEERAAREASGAPFALRLDSRAASRTVGTPLYFEEAIAGDAGQRGRIQAESDLAGDIVLARKDIGCSYHVAVVVDDGLQGITHVTRGRDLFAATHVQRLLQELLSLPTPAYHHHDLVRDPSGQRLATRDRSESLANLRQHGETPGTIRERLGLPGPSSTP